MKPFLFCFTVAVFSFSSLAQYQPTIQTGRPGQGIGPGVVGTGVLQWQAGFDLQQIEQTPSDRTNQTFNNILRLGLSERFEISSIIDYSDDEIAATSTRARQGLSGISQFQFGFRYVLNEASPEEWFPAVGLQTRFRFESVGGDYRRNELAPIFILATSKGITDQISLSVNAGMAYDGFTPTPTYSYVVGLSQSLNSRWGTLYEAYGQDNAGQKTNYLGLGLSYLMTSNFQWDGYISTGNNMGIRETYMTLGLSWRGRIFR